MRFEVNGRFGRAVQRASSSPRFAPVASRVLPLYDVTARLLAAQEKAEKWRRLTKVWPAYDAYVELSGGRDIRVFRLTTSS
jgi:hypothetical protein